LIRARRICLCSALLFASYLPAQQTESAEARVNAQRDELARIRAERDELEKKMSGLQNTAHELRDEVNLLDKQHDATARMVTSLDQQLVAITDEVKTTTGGSTARTVMARLLWYVAPNSASSPVTAKVRPPPICSPAALSQQR